ncbi:MAG: transaldolase family protein [SAR324 cluster bacterium]|nr:transaldolase family protein [SAR324 cluster bacterium]
MKLTSETATDFWNDSCSLKELSEAVAQGAVGATSNPVIVGSVVKGEQEIWMEVIDALILDNPNDTEEKIAWRLIETIGIRAAKILEPVFEESRGLKGRLSLQVNPMNYPNKNKMVEQAKYLSALAPNIAIKAPVTATGIEAIEEMTSTGIVVNGTVCSTLPQAIACAEAIERGLKRAGENGVDTSQMRPYVTIMVGRLDDNLRRVMSQEKISVDPGCLEWAGIAVFKKAYKIFRERGYRGTLLSAAYRNHMQWSQFIGGEVVLTIPYPWWNQFNNSDIEIRPRMEDPVDPEIVDALYRHFDAFKMAYDESGMQPEQFIRDGATIHTLKQFIAGYHDLLAFVRDRMLG